MIKKIKKIIFPYYRWLKVFIKTYVIVDELFLIRQKFKSDDEKYGLRYNYPLNEDSLILDFGGYTGEWSERMWNKYKCNIYIFEPVSQYFNEASKKFKSNTKVKIFNFGLSDINKTELISISGVASSTFVGKRDTEIILRDVKEVFQELNIEKVDLLKINIEGGEYKVLPKMINEDLINKCTDIQIEFHKFYLNAEELRTKIQEALKKTHYVTYDYSFFFENWRKISHNFSQLI